LEREFKHGCDVEAVFTALQVQKRTLFHHLRSMLCECFDAIAARKNAALYARFARDVAGPEDVVITFNYDVSMELALREAGKWDIHDGYGFRILDSVRQSAVKVLKLHGSTSWLDVLVPVAHGGFRKSDPTAEGYGERPQILPEHFKMFGYSGEVRDPSFVGGASVRAGSMILPTQDKDFGNRKVFWDGLWGQAREALHSASEIIVIGYSMPASDKRPTELILSDGRKRASVTICSRGDNARLIEAFERKGFERLSGDLPDFESWLDEA
jgi:hypothetical protein